MRRLPLLAAVLAMAQPARATTQVPPTALRVQVLARALEPGELLRVVVRAPEPLADVKGTLHGEPLYFVKDGDDDAGAAWSAWAATDLDWPAGDVIVEASGRTPGGIPARGSATFTLAAKSFPVQELKVEGKYVNPPKAAQARIKREQALLAALYRARRPVPPPRAAFERPVDGQALGVFGARRVFNGEKRSPHPGLDLRAATGTPVRAAGPGLVALAQDLYFSGNTVILDHGGGLFTVYAHLSKLGVKTGASVAEGQELGLSGATGRVTGPHLHWGGKLGARIFDPTALLDVTLFEEPAIAD